MTVNLTTDVAALAGPVVVGPPHSKPAALDDWQLLQPVGEGTIARVFRARAAAGDTHGGATYAVKVLRPEWEADAQVVAMFRREALAGRSVSHPHVVPVLSHGTVRSPRFLVMPWLEGATLRSRLQSGWCPETNEALWIARQAAEGLEGLHAAGWMHGDVKPDNLLLSADGHATLLDLGFARRCGESCTAVHRYVAGTFNYLAPEMLTSKLQADIRSDIYSLGVVLYELLSGRLPYRSLSPSELASQHRKVTAAPLSAVLPQADPALVGLVRAMIAKEPLRRPQTPSELVARLAELEIAAFAARVL